METQVIICLFGRDHLFLRRPRPHSMLFWNVRLVGIKHMLYNVSKANVSTRILTDPFWFIKSNMLTLLYMTLGIRAVAQVCPTWIYRTSQPLSLQWSQIQA